MGVVRAVGPESRKRGFWFSLGPRCRAKVFDGAKRVCRRGLRPRYRGEELVIEVKEPIAGVGSSETASELFADFAGSFS